jgi:hypothetical protein
MKKLLIIIVACAFWVSCSENNQKGGKPDVALPVTLDTAKQIVRTASIVTKIQEKVQPIKNPDFIVFGIFCGECVGECSTMYKLDFLKNKLLVDHSDSYFKSFNETPTKFESEIQDASKLSIAKNIAGNIPDIILSSNKISEKFGCPDCSDGCGIYLELQKDTAVRKFYIDYQTTSLSGEIKHFSEYMAKAIHNIETK